MDKKNVGKNMRKFLKEKFGKLNIAADKLGILPQTLQKYLNGQFLPGSEMIAKLKKLGCDTDWLLEVDKPSDVLTAKEQTVQYTENDVIVSQAKKIVELDKALNKVTNELNEMEKEVERLKKQVKEDEQKKSKREQPVKSDRLKGRKREKVN